MRRRALFRGGDGKLIADHQGLTPTHSNDVLSSRGSGGFFFAGPGALAVEFLDRPTHGDVSYAGGPGGRGVAYVPHGG